MWFRGVAASMGLCFNLGAILKGHPNVVLAVNGDVVHHRQPIGIPELRQRLPAPQLLQVGFDLMLSGHVLAIRSVTSVCRALALSNRATRVS